MGIKLRILSIWPPKFIINQELERTAKLTNNGLDQLIRDYSGSPPKHQDLSGSLDDKREIMAKGHNLRVKILMDILGEKQAIKLGKKRMYDAGLILGQKARKDLGVGNGVEDTIKAAKILYKILGIDFATEITSDNIVMWVDSCDLSHYYTPETCSIMSYADRGVLKGLNKNMDMEFVEKITTGSKRCKACINIKGKGES